MQKYILILKEIVNMECDLDIERRNTRKDKLKTNKKHPYKAGGHTRIKWLHNKRIDVTKIKKK